MTNTPLIRIRNLNKSFGSRTILDDASLDINRHEITAIIGKSGVGKSVLVKHIIGLIEADSGEIIFDGTAYSTMGSHEFSRIKNRCSYMFQNNALFDSMSIYENIALPLREKYTFTTAQIETKVRTQIEQLELTEVAHLYPKQISGGMQKRVALARALVTEPEIIFFDEPTTGLDPIRKKNVFSLIHRYHEKLNFTAVIITHDIPDIFYIAHTVHIIESGKIAFSGSPESLEQSTDPLLYPYTHGHEILIDELTGLQNRLALTRSVNSLAASTTETETLILGAVHIRGLRTVMDYNGQLVGHTIIKAFAKFVHEILPPKACAGSYSMEVLVVAIKTTDVTMLQTIHNELARFFNTPNIRTFCQQYKLQIEIGGSQIAKDQKFCNAIHNALETAKKYL